MTLQRVMTRQRTGTRQKQREQRTERAEAVVASWEQRVMATLKQQKQQLDLTRPSAQTEEVWHSLGAAAVMAVPAAERMMLMPLCCRSSPAQSRAASQ